MYPYEIENEARTVAQVLGKAVPVPDTIYGELNTDIPAKNRSLYATGNLNGRVVRKVIEAK